MFHTHPPYEVLIPCQKLRCDSQYQVWSSGLCFGHRHSRPLTRAQEKQVRRVVRAEEESLQGTIARCGVIRVVMLPLDDVSAEGGSAARCRKWRRTMIFFGRRIYKKTLIAENMKPLVLKYVVIIIHRFQMWSRGIFAKDAIPERGSSETLLSLSSSCLPTSYIRSKHHVSKIYGTT